MSGRLRAGLEVGQRDDHRSACIEPDEPAEGADSRSDGHWLAEQLSEQTGLPAPRAGGDDHPVADRRPGDARRGRRRVVDEQEALVTEGTNNYVYVLEDSTAARREVQAGARIDGMVEILSGIRPGEVAITAGQAGLQDGAVVRVVEPRETLQREN